MPHKKNSLEKGRETIPPLEQCSPNSLVLKIKINSTVFLIQDTGIPARQDGSSPLFTRNTKFGLNLKPVHQHAVHFSCTRTLIEMGLFVVYYTPSEGNVILVFQLISFQGIYMLSLLLFYILPESAQNSIYVKDL